MQFAKLDGGQLRLADLRGRVVVLNFWATWCIPCRSEIPALSSMQKAMGAEGLTIVGVSYDDTRDLVQEFQKDLKQDYTVVLGGKDVGAIAGIATAYNLHHRSPGTHPRKIHRGKKSGGIRICNQTAAARRCKHSPKITPGISGGNGDVEIRSDTSDRAGFHAGRDIRAKRTRVFSSG